jgi:hypothetical protein
MSRFIRSVHLAYQSNRTKSQQLMVKKREKDVVIKHRFFVGLLASPRIFIRMGPGIKPSTQLYCFSANTFGSDNLLQYPTLFSKKTKIKDQYRLNIRHHCHL